MRLTFTDTSQTWGTVTDDGETYEWEYAGSDAEITALLTEAGTWTGVESGPDPDNEDAIAYERFDARLDPERRLERLRRVLRPHTRLLELSYE